MLIILFGLAGSGKSFVGKILAKHFGYYFWDADDALPEDMQESIRNKQSFTQAMRDQHTQIVINKIYELQKSHTKLVVAHALYKEINRLQLQAQFSHAKFIHVKAESNIIARRLKQRDDSVDEHYALKISANFEKPLLTHDVLINNLDENAVIQQLQAQTEPRL